MATQKRDWAALGIKWTESVVHLDEDRKDQHRAIIPIVEDVDKLYAWLGKERVRGILNESNSPRVAVQAINRTAAKKKLGFDWVMEQFYAWAMKTRVGAVVVHLFPDGGTFAGDDETAYRAEYAQKLVDMGVEGGKALEVAQNVRW